MKTFQAIIDEYGENAVYPSLDGLDDGFKNAVSMWFSSREVSSDQNFIRFFQRILVRDFGQYKQLLRIEPGVASYDWLVQKYNEAMTETTKNSSESTSGETSQTVTYDLENASQSSGTENVDKLTTNDLYDAKTNTRTLTHGATVSTVATDTNQAGGSDVHTGNTKTDTKSLQKESPMSISYSGGVNIDGTGSQTRQGLDWQYPSAQGETAGVDESSDTTAYGRSDTRTLNSTVTNGGDDLTVDSGSVTKTGTVSEGTEKTDSATVTATKTGTTGTAGESSGTRTETGTDVVKHIDTGRAVDISTLLVNATSFIVNSSAWEWIRKRLEPCFMAIYSDDDLNEGGI